MAWNNTDFSLASQDPYRHHAFELHFGLTDAAAPLSRNWPRCGHSARCSPRSTPGAAAEPMPRTALVVPSYLEREYPFTFPEDRAYLAAMLRQAYICSRLADLPVAVARESDGIGEDAQLYLVPATKQLLGPTWQHLDRLAQAGATVYVSYSRGGHAIHRGPWHTHLNEMFGVEHQLGYPPDETIADEAVTLTFVTDFGTLAEGTRLSLAVEGNMHGRGFLPLKPASAEVLAVDSHGRPALLRRRTGAGSVILCTYPLEHLAAAAAVARCGSDHRPLRRARRRCRGQPAGHRERHQGRGRRAGP